ncbi:MAG: hypothetical protein HYW57_05065 [Ignavibacteriales bacterium]|nr:hypothetical protein [Ignavibacteriales bacterium]
MSHSIRAILAGALIWVSGFVWGTVVFMIPALKDLPSLPFFSRYPAISFPLFLVFWVMSASLTRRIFRAAEGKARTARGIGIAFAGTNILLDLVVLVVAFGNGLEYYSSLSVWAAYGILFLVPTRMIQREPSEKRHG